MKAEGRIEFWTHGEGGLFSRMLAGFDSDAPPPPVAARVQIKSVDYWVTAIEYTIDRAGQLGMTYRRSVFVVSEPPQ